MRPNEEERDNAYPYKVITVINPPSHSFEVRKLLSSTLLCCFFVILHKVVLTFEFVDEILKCEHSKESYWVVLSSGAFIMLYKVVLNFEFMDEILKCGHLNKSVRAVLSFTVFWVLSKSFQSIRTNITPCMYFELNNETRQQRLRSERQILSV